MKATTFLFILLSTFILSCQDKHSIDFYFDQSSQDTLLTDIITYVYVYPPNANWDTRFDMKFRNHYKGSLKKFRFEKLYRDTDGMYYFFIIRPARSAEGSIRGTGGRFKLNAENKIVFFEEVFNTPVASLEELSQRGDELFTWMIKNGNVDDYLKDPRYIEWPNEWTYYDSTKHEWLVKPAI